MKTPRTQVLPTHPATKEQFSISRIAAVQMKFAPTIEGNLGKIEAAIREAVIRRRADVVLFPECATTGYAYDFSSLRPTEIREALARVGKLAAAHRVNILVGSPLFRGRHLENCLVVFDRGGNMVHCYSKCQLTESDRRYFRAGNSIGLFEIDGVLATAIICHERRYPELVRLAVMAGAKILFHPNAGLDKRSVSLSKHGGRDGIAVRAFENSIYYVFANSVGPQGHGKWSSGDTKIVAPDGTVLQLADNATESIVVAKCDLAKATRKYAEESLSSPRFLAPSWKKMLKLVREQAARSCANVKAH
jgi:predicted amidohydrolase